MIDQRNKARYAINNVSLKDISKIIKEFEKLPNEGYVQKRPNNEPTDSYLYLSRQLAKCIMRADTLNSKVDPIRTETNITQQIHISQLCYLDKIKSKGIISDKNLSQVCYMDTS